MFSQEAIKLLKPCFEAIKTLAEKQEKKCNLCEGSGLRRAYIDSTVKKRCEDCNGIGKIKGKWKWKPEVGELFALPDYKYNPHHLGIYLYTSDNFVYYYFLPKKEIVTTQIGYFEYCTPFLHWEGIITILRSFGYLISFRENSCRIGPDRPLGMDSGDYLAWKRCNVIEVLGAESTQCAVMQAAIEGASRFT